jgi:hypothetical protein
MLRVLDSEATSPHLTMRRGQKSYGQLVAQAEIKRAESTDSPYGQLLETALGIIRDAREGYSAADAYVKHLWNRALMERIEIRAGQIARVELKEPFTGLFLCAGSNRDVWSGRGDLNPRPPDPQSGALPSCATPRWTRYRSGFPIGVRVCRHRRPDPYASTRNLTRAGPPQAAIP